MTTLFALVAFVVSAAIHALTPAGVTGFGIAAADLSGTMSMTMAQSGALAEGRGNINVVDLFLRPDNIVLWAC